MAIENEKPMYEKINELLGTNYTGPLSSINWYSISKQKNLPENFIWEFKDYIYPYLVTLYSDFSDELLRKLINYNSEWNDIISVNINLSEDFIEEFKDDLSWGTICEHQFLSCAFMDKYNYKLDWFAISRTQKLSEDFIWKYKDKVDWLYISKYQKLSEPFIEEFSSYVQWDCIFKYQYLSEFFIKKHHTFAFAYASYRYQKLSEDFIKEKNWHPDTSDIWLYKDADFKKQEIIKTGLYECHDDYFIAYKAVRPDRYSLYNFQYKYEKGCIYESTCDTTNEENSFGLNVGTKEHAREYGTGNRFIIVKCKVKYEDVGRIVHGGEKLRCFKIEILD